MLISEFRQRFAKEGMTPELIKDFQNHVLEFYKAKGRHDQVWRMRQEIDPYTIVVSEVMLQQTQVPRVAELFPPFIEKFPNFQTLATASQTELLSAWQGLGYNRRALHLQKLAQKVLDEFDGELPDDPKVLETLPGLGPATSSSIAAFVFNKPVVFIETNIRRVFIHYFFSDDAIVSDAELYPLIEKTLPENSREWYWALMDLGTELKKSVPNPNRRSKSYVKQKKFAGSNREVRGKILRELLMESCDEELLAEKISCDKKCVKKILDEMQAEGFFVRDESGRYSVK